MTARSWKETWLHYGAICHRGLWNQLRNSCFLKVLCCCWLFQEMWNCPYSNDSFPIYAEDIDAGPKASPSTAMLSEVARIKNVTIVGGSIPERSNGNLYNTCCVFDKNGELKAKFRKVHLMFSIDYSCSNYVTNSLKKSSIWWYRLVLSTTHILATTVWSQWSRWRT